MNWDYFGTSSSEVSVRYIKKHIWDFTLSDQYVSKIFHNVWVNAYSSSCLIHPEFLSNTSNKVCWYTLYDIKSLTHYSFVDNSVEYSSNVVSNNLIGIIDDAVRFSGELSATSIGVFPMGIGLAHRYGNPAWLSSNYVIKY